jgi:hypothetical protein
LTGFDYGFGFSLILKCGDGADNEDIGTLPEPVPHIYNYILPLLNYKPLNKILNYIHIFVSIFKLSIKQSCFSIFILCLNK